MSIIEIVFGSSTIDNSTMASVTCSTNGSVIIGSIIGSVIIELTVENYIK